MAGGRTRRSASPPTTSQSSRRGGRGAATSARSTYSQMPAIAEGSSQQPTAGDDQPDPDVDVDTSDPEVVRARTSQEGDFSRIVDTARASPDRQRITRSRREESAGPAPPTATGARPSATAAASVAAVDARSSRRAAHSRGMTPEGQLQQDLRRASAEPESPTVRAQQQQESSQQDVSSGSVQEQSSVSWITERGLRQPEQQRTRRERQQSPLRRSQRQQPQAQTQQNAGPGGDTNDVPVPSSSSSRRTPRPAAAAAAAAAATPDESSEDSAGPATDRSGHTAMSNNPIQNAPVLQPTTSQATANAPRVVAKREHARTAAAAAPPSGAAPSVPATAVHPTAPTVGTIAGRQRTKLTAPIIFTIILLGMSAFFMLAAFHDNIKSLSPRLPRLPFSIWGGCDKQIPISYGSSADATEALEKLSSAFDSKLADMANDVAAAKAEMDRKLADIPQVSPNPMAAMRVNFFSIGTGAIVDPYLTSPTMQPPTSFAERVFGRMVGVPMDGMAPVAALKPWHDIGECWCASGSRPQLAVLLGYPIVPEEVVVDHIPKDETLDPSLAPQEMELWAEFSPVSSADTGGDSPKVAPFRSRRSEAAASASSSSRTDFPRRTSNANSRSQHPLSPKSLDSSAHEYLLSTLRMTYPGEPDSAFSDNPRLGPNYFRLGKWRYDIHRPHNIQRFRLDAVVDIPGYRVKKAIVRTTSNFGGSHTCLYRVRLHGQT